MRVLLSIPAGSQQEEKGGATCISRPLHENNKYLPKQQQQYQQQHQHLFLSTKEEGRNKRKTFHHYEDSGFATLPEEEEPTKKPRNFKTTAQKLRSFATTSSTTATTANPPDDEEDCKPPAKPSAARKPAPASASASDSSKPSPQLKMGYQEPVPGRLQDDEDDQEHDYGSPYITVKSSQSSQSYTSSSDDEPVTGNPISTVADTSTGTINSTCTSTNTLAQQLKSRGLEICLQEGDGNCFFRAVSLQVYGDANMHPEVRQRCCDFMAKDEAHFSQFIDDEEFADYVERKRQDGVHGNNPEMQAISELFNRPVEVYTEASGGAYPINIFQSDYKDQFPIRLSYHDGNHYNAIVDPFVPTAGLGLGMPGLKPGLADQLQLSNAIIRSDEEEDVEHALKESRQLTASQQSDDLQRALKESALALADNRLASAIFKSDVDITNFELEQAVLESCIGGGNCKIPARVPVPSMVPSSSSSSSMSLPIVQPVASIPATRSSEVPLVASLPSDEMVAWTAVPRQDEEYPQTVQELVMNGFDFEKVAHAYELLGDNFDDLLCYLVSNQRS